MLPLPPTKYPNVQRTVTGAVDVFPDDVVLNCDTSAGAVTISLGEIPYNSTTGQGFWSTQYKLYINDISNNAGTNNITIVAGAGQTINNSATAVINVNGGSAYIMISGNTEFSIVYSPAQALPPDFITVTYAQLSALILANNLVAGAFYNVSDAEFGSTPIIPTNVYIQALTTNTVSMTGQGYFYNADYQGVGNYSGVTGFTSQLGIWTSLLVTPIGSVVIWDNGHYVNTTGINGANNPKIDVANWTLLALNSTNGYVVEISFISYFVNNNRILSRTDNFGNFVERAVLGGLNSFNFFKWGSVDVKQNNVSRNSLLYNCNVTTAGLLSFFGNTLYDSVVTLGGATDGGSITAWTINLMESSTVTFGKSGGQLTNNKLYSFILTGENSGDISGNYFARGDLSNILNSGGIIANVVQDSQTLIIKNAGFISNNKINSSDFSINIVNNGKIGNNDFSASSVISVDTNDATGEISKNTIVDSTITITNNDGKISANEILGQSVCTISNVAVNGEVSYTNIDGRSTFSLTNVLGIIGVGAKGTGNIITNESTFTVVTYNPISPNFYGNVLSTGAIVEIDTFNGAFVGNEISNTEIKLQTLNGNTITATVFSNSKLGTPAYSLPQSFNDGTVLNGLSTLSFNLDCSVLSTYNAGTQTLTIPSEVGEAIGKYVLTNAGGITIAKIIGLNTAFNTTFFSDNGTITFTSVAVGVATPTEIVSPIGAGSYSVVKHTTVSDSISLVSRGLLCVVEDSNILL